MVFVAVIYSVTSALGKRATQMAGATLFPALYFSLIAVSFALLQGARGFRPAAFLRAVRLRPVLLVGLGVMDGVTFLLHSVGVLLTPVAYFVGVKRLSSVVSVVLGGILFREGYLGVRVAGAVCMALGVLLLVY